MLKIKDQRTVPLKAIPVTELLFEEFITLEDQKSLSQVHDFFDRQGDDPLVSKSYSILEDLNLNDLILKFNKSIEYYSNEVLKTSLQFKMTGSWLTKNSKGTFHSPHKHPNCHISAVSYFGDFSESESAGIQFLDLGLNSVFNENNIDFYNVPDQRVKPDDCNMFNSQVYTIKTKKNQIIIFPGHLKHKSEICKSENRFCVGVNYFLTGTFGCALKKTLVSF